MKSSKIWMELARHVSGVSYDDDPEAAMFDLDDEVYALGGSNVTTPAGEASGNVTGGDVTEEDENVFDDANPVLVLLYDVLIILQVTIMIFFHFCIRFLQCFYVLIILQVTIMMVVSHLFCIRFLQCFFVLIILQVTIIQMILFLFFNFIVTLSFDPPLVKSSAPLNVIDYFVEKKKFLTCAVLRSLVLISELVLYVCCNPCLN